jgi:hypothetical protein
MVVPLDKNCQLLYCDQLKDSLFFFALPYSSTMIKGSVPSKANCLKEMMTALYLGDVFPECSDVVLFTSAFDCVTKTGFQCSWSLIYQLVIIPTKFQSLW